MTIIMMMMGANMMMVWQYYSTKITCLEELKCYELAKKMLTALIMQNKAYAK